MTGSSGHDEGEPVADRGRRAGVGVAVAGWR